MSTRPVNRIARRNRLRGMSLIETMVGMTLGILVSLIITQVWGVFENQKQRTISATAGQATGLLALTELEQDVRSAGAGLTDTSTFNCNAIFSYYENGGTQISPVPAYAGSMGMAPVQIVDVPSLRVVDELRPGRAVLHIEFTPRGEQAWVSARDDDKVVVLDTATRRTLKEIKVDKPSGIFLAARANRIGS